MQVGLGLIGCGGFGRWCLEQYRLLPNVKAVACADSEPVLAHQTADQFGLVACDSVAELLARDDVQVVHIATPPWAHAEPTLQSLEAGKHVLCEKPLAIDLDDARRAVDLARSKNLVLSANLIMRYDPLSDVVREVLQRKILGEPIYATFVNCAKDEQLGPDHWFWDESKSGGIFIEHGVHFFDLFAYWFGEGEVLTAQKAVRPGTTNLIEQVSCQCRYGNVLCDFYHGFTQAARMDRQEFRIVCERGDIRLTEWVPTTIEVDGLMDRETLETLATLVPNARMHNLANYAEADRPVYSRHKHYEVDSRARVSGDLEMTKMEIYSLMVRELLADQIRAIADPSHQRKITEQNGYRSLELAVQANTIARQVG